MTTRLSPYLRFHGNARNAMNFYATVFGGTLNISTYADMRADINEADSELVVHSMLTGATGLVLLSSDIPLREPFTAGGAFSVSVSGEDEAELTEYWDKLSYQGSILTPFSKSSWGTVYGSCVDRFGVTWLVNLMPARPAHSA